MRSAGQAADVFFVDELGPLELVRGEGWADVIPMIRARAFGAALVVVRPELIEMARGQMALPPETPVITVNRRQPGSGGSRARGLDQAAR